MKKEEVDYRQENLDATCALDGTTASANGWLSMGRLLMLLLVLCRAGWMEAAADIHLYSLLKLLDLKHQKVT